MSGLNGRLRHFAKPTRSWSVPEPEWASILMFGDWSWLDERTRAQQERFRLWVEGLEESRARFVVVELGAGTAVPTVRLTSERLTAKLRGTLIRLNSREAIVPDHAIGIALSALKGVERLYAAL
jgi:hypothetical protein